MIINRHAQSSATTRRLILINDVPRNRRKPTSEITRCLASYIPAPILFALLLAIVLNVAAQSPAWGQCGGIGWSGATTCVCGYACTVSNPYYSQCLPGTGRQPRPLPHRPLTSQLLPSHLRPPLVRQAQQGPKFAPLRTLSSTFTSRIRVRRATCVSHISSPAAVLVGGASMLGPESPSGRFTIGRTTISLNGTDGSKLYLNVDQSSTSWQDLLLGYNAFAVFVLIYIYVYLTIML
ncbi:hypothetical protein BDN71DRAFT_705917 [Pleurotus eryngii]|uniref:CBM1 domain-containing protein n=1 Tax=Pleurotus eryngii TaxID=5323 RepID=A0A9P6AAN3_PLEER|nr:hypothetical protein BDN71DRAFT_705917 [Pleurotus eryngii]